MSFDTHYPRRKDHRAAFYRSKATSRGCRNHGCCEWCVGNRTHRHRRRAPLTTVEELRP